MRVVRGVKQLDHREKYLEYIEDRNSSTVRGLSHLVKARIMGTRLLYLLGMGSRKRAHDEWDPANGV